MLCFAGTIEISICKRLKGETELDFVNEVLKPLANG